MTGDLIYNSVKQPEPRTKEPDPDIHDLTSDSNQDHRKQNVKYPVGVNSLSKDYEKKYK